MRRVSPVGLIGVEFTDVESRFVMLWVKRMISGSFAAALALAALSGSLWASLAYAQPSTTIADAREKPRQGASPATPAQRNQRDAKRPNAKRTGETQRPQRMSPEERRQLRRDIKDAGRQIYPQRRSPVNDAGEDGE